MSTEKEDNFPASRDFIDIEDNIFDLEGFQHMG